MSKKERKKQKERILQEIYESSLFWEQIFNEEALQTSVGERIYANPWFPVEFARGIRELAEVALESKNHEKSPPFLTHPVLFTRVQQFQMPCAARVFERCPIIALLATAVRAVYERAIIKGVNRR